MKRVAVLLMVLAVATGTAAGQADPLSWVNSLRRAAAEPAVAPDEVLSETARLWAARLLEAGVLSHRGSDGSSVLDRYRLLGGTEARVGEILGAGASLPDIEEGWVRSEEHRALTVDPGWTHVGWGMAGPAPGMPPGETEAGTRAVQVWVVVFCEKLVDELRIEEAPGRVSVSGVFIPRGAAEAVLYSGLQVVTPETWDPATRRFTFVVSGPVLAGYIRLGFLSATGAFRLTNAFTLPREKGSPAGTGRFSAPAARP